MRRVGATRLEWLGRPAHGSTRIDVMFAIIVNLTNVFEIAITLFGIWRNKMFDFNSHQWCVNLPRVARQPAPHMGQVDAGETVSLVQYPKYYYTIDMF